MGKVVSGITDAIGLTSVKKDKRRAQRRLAEQERTTKAAEKKQDRTDEARRNEKRQSATARRGNRQGGFGGVLGLLGGRRGAVDDTQPKATLLGGGN